jgi:hypothetical protein
VIEQGGNPDAGLSIVECTCLHEVALLQVEPNLVPQLVPDLLECFPVVEMWYLEFIAPLVQVRSDALEQLQFLFEPFFNPGLRILKTPSRGAPSRLPRSS